MYVAMSQELLAFFIVFPPGMSKSGTPTLEEVVLIPPWDGRSRPIVLIGVHISECRVINYQPVHSCAYIHTYIHTHTHTRRERKRERE